MVVKPENASLRPLPADLQEKAAQELNEKPARVGEDIAALREWLRKQPHLENIKPTDQWLLTFLRGSKFSLEKSKEKLDMYYTLRSSVPEIFSDRDPLNWKIQHILKSGTYLPLKNPIKGELTRAILVRYGVCDSSILLTDLIKVSFMIMDIMMLEDDNIIVAGEVCLVDMKDMGMNVLSQWTPTLAKKVIKGFEEALPIRMKGTLVFNMPYLFESAYNIFKTFLGQKLKDRFQVFSKQYDEMNKRVSKSTLPKEYNGEDGSIDELTEYWKAKVESYRDWFLQQETVCSDERRRPSAQQNSSELSNVGSVVGSFRKLEVD